MLQRDDDDDESEEDLLRGRQSNRQMSRAKREKEDGAAPNEDSFIHRISNRRFNYRDDDERT